MRYIALYGLLKLQGNEQPAAGDMNTLAEKMGVKLNDKKLEIVLDELNRIDFLERVQKG